MAFPERVGDFGTVFIALAVFLCFCYAVGCFIAGALLFFLKREHGYIWQTVWLVGFIVAGVCILIGAIVAAFFPLDPIPGWVGFGICFAVMAVILVIMLVLLYLSTRKGHYLNIYLVASVITPICMGAAFIGIFILMVDELVVGQTFLMIVVIVAIVCAFLYGCGLLIAAGVFIWRAIARDELVLHLLWIIGSITCGLLCIVGAIVAAFYDLSYEATIAGLALCFVVQGVITAIFIVGYFFIGRTDTDIEGFLSWATAWKWGRIGLILVNAVFAGISISGVLAAATALVIA